jgi:hypothetical protein
MGRRARAPVVGRELERERSVKRRCGVWLVQLAPRLNSWVACIDSCFFVLVL